MKFMNNRPDNIEKDLSEQPNFKDEIGSKNQDHHTFDLGNQSTLKKIQHFLHGNPTIVPVIISLWAKNPDENPKNIKRKNLMNNLGINYFFLKKGV